MNKPFNLQAALAGDPVVTFKNGAKVVKIQQIQEITQFPGNILVVFEDGDYGWFSEKTAANYLYMAPKKVVRYVNFYEGGTAYHYKTEGAARFGIDAESTLAIAVPVEFEVK